VQDQFTKCGKSMARAGKTGTLKTICFAYLSNIILHRIILGVIRRAVRS